MQLFEGYILNNLAWFNKYLWPCSVQIGEAYSHAALFFSSSAAHRGTLWSPGAASRPLELPQCNRPQVAWPPSWIRSQPPRRLSNAAVNMADILHRLLLVRNLKHTVNVIIAINPELLNENQVYSELVLSLSVFYLIEKKHTFG